MTVSVPPAAVLSTMMSPSTKTSASSCSKVTKDKSPVISTPMELTESTTKVLSPPAFDSNSIWSLLVPTASDEVKVTSPSNTETSGPVVPLRIEPS